MLILSALIKNEMRSYFVYLKRHKLYTFSNVLGLTIAYAFCLVAFSYVVRQLYTDSHHVKADNIYLVGQDNGNWSSYWMHRHILQRWPDEVLAGTSISKSIERCRVGDVDIIVPIIRVDSLFFDMFTYDIVSGDITDFRRSNQSAVVSEEYAAQCGGNEAVIGARLTSHGHDYTVCAVMRKPDNTVLNAEVITSAYDRMMLDGVNGPNCGPSMLVFGNCMTAILLKDDVDVDKLQAQLTDTFIGREWVIYNLDLCRQMRLEHFRDAYFGGGYDKQFPHGDNDTVLLVGLLGMALAVFAGRNYASLTLVQTNARSKEMAVRQLIGTSRFSIVLRLFCESLILSLFSLVFAVVLAKCLDGQASEMLGYKFAIFDEFRLWHYLLVILFAVVVALIASITPTVAISRSKPIDIVRNSFKDKLRRSYNRVSFQYAICFALVIPTICIWLQTDHLVNAPMGYNTDDISLLEIRSQSNLDSLRSELLKLDCVESVGLCTDFPLDVKHNMLVSINGKSSFCGFVMGDSTYFDILGLHVKEEFTSRRFSPSLVDGVYRVGIWLDEDAVRAMGVSRQNPVFETKVGDYQTFITVYGSYGHLETGTVLDNNIYAWINNWGSKWSDIAFRKPNRFVLKLAHGVHHDDAEEAVLSVYRRFQPSADVRLLPVREMFERLYASDLRTSRVSMTFTGLCLLISLLGLYASTVFGIQQSRRKIAIWRICGASYFMITRYMTYSYVKMLTLSFLIVCPLSYFFCEMWLDNYEYRIAHPLYIYFLVYFGALLLLALTLFILIYRVTFTSPTRLMKN